MLNQSILLLFIFFIKRFFKAKLGADAIKSVNGKLKMKYSQFIQINDYIDLNKGQSFTVGASSDMLCKYLPMEIVALKNN